MAADRATRRRRSSQVGVQVTSATPFILRLPRSAILRVSPAMFEHICAENDFLRLERTATGGLVVMAPAGSESGGQNADLITDLNIWARADGTGRVFDATAGFTLPNRETVGPDGAWILWERWNAVPADERKRFAAIVPDFVMELRSPSDRIAKLRAKMRRYIHQGVRLAWLIDPIRQQVEIYRPGREPEILLKPASLSGEEVLPGFVLDLRGILSD